jgi:hypothetical protein
MPSPKYKEFDFPDSQDILAVAWSNYYLTIAFRRGFVFRYRDVPYPVYQDLCKNPTATYVAEQITGRFESLIIGETP